MWIANLTYVPRTDPRSATSAKQQGVGVVACGDMSSEHDPSAWIDLRSATPTKEEGVWLVAGVNIEQERHPCVIGRPANREIGPATGDRLRARMCVWR